MPKPKPTPPDFQSAPKVGSLIFWHFARRFAPWLLGLAAYLVLATWVVRWDMARRGEAPLDFGAELYGMYTQLFFEPTQNLPLAPVARVVFWITPLLGAILIARGVLRVGASVFDVEERRRLWVKVMSDGMKGHIVVCGLGHVGIRVVEALRELGAPVVAIEKNQADSFGSVVEALGVPVHFGDARRDELLVRAGIRRAKAVVCATDDDLTNLEISIDARRENPSIRVIMRMFDKRVAAKIGSALHLDETFSTSALAGPLIALQATEPGVRGAYRLEDGSMRVNLETLPPDAWRGRTVAACEDEMEGRIVGLRRGEAFLRPKHDTKIEEGDHLTLDLPAENLGRVRPRALAPP